MYKLVANKSFTSQDQWTAPCSPVHDDYSLRNAVNKWLRIECWTSWIANCVSFFSHSGSNKYLYWQMKLKRLAMSLGQISSRHNPLWYCDLSVEDLTRNIPHLPLRMWRAKAHVLRLPIITTEQRNEPRHQPWNEQRVFWTQSNALVELKLKKNAINWNFKL